MFLDRLIPKKHPEKNLHDMAQRTNKNRYHNNGRYVLNTMFNAIADAVEIPGGNS
jgi:hypothetical protein